MLRRRGRDCGSRRYEGGTLEIDHGKSSRACAAQKRHADKKSRWIHSLHVGEWVFVKVSCLGHYQDFPKLEPKYWGPYQVMEKINDNVYRIEFPAGVRAHNAINVCNLERAKERPAWMGVQQEPQNMGTRGDHKAEILRITDERRVNG